MTCKLNAARWCRRYAIWLNWVGVPENFDERPNSDVKHICLSRRSELENDYAGIYSLWLYSRLREWVRALGDRRLHGFVRGSDADVGCALEIEENGVKGQDEFDDWLEKWCQTHKCPVRFVNYEQEIQECADALDEEDKVRQSRKPYRVR